MVSPTAEVAMRFTYDELGAESVSYNGSTYYYVKNVQGDVIAIEYTGR